MPRIIFKGLAIGLIIMGFLWLGVVVVSKAWAEPFEEGTLAIGIGEFDDEAWLMFTWDKEECATFEIKDDRPTAIWDGEKHRPIKWKSLDKPSGNYVRRSDGTVIDIGSWKWKQEGDQVTQVPVESVVTVEWLPGVLRLGMYGKGELQAETIVYGYQLGLRFRDGKPDGVVFRVVE